MEINQEITCKLCDRPQLNPLGYLEVKEQYHIADNIDMFDSIIDIQLLESLLPSLHKNEIELLATGICDECRETL